MTHWWLTLHPWQQLALMVPALCLLFCLYYMIFAIASEWKRQSQHEQDRRAFVTRFRKGGPDEIDEHD